MDETRPKVIPPGSVFSLERGPDGAVRMVVRPPLGSLQGYASVREGFDPWAFDVANPRVTEQPLTPEHEQQVLAISIHMNRRTIESDGKLVLDCLRKLLLLQMRVPGWLSEAFVARLDRLRQFEARSLDECFDNKPRTERQRQALKRRRELVRHVHDAAHEAVRADAGQALDNELFEQVAAKFGIGRVLCRSLYDEAVQKLGMQDLAELKRIAKTLPVGKTTH